MKLKKTLIDLRDMVLGYYSKKSYSQEGEDMILNRFFQFKDNGFYVDVGAHHPMRFSNTYFFYQKGWRGINIDAMPGSMKKFKRYRSRDINLEIAISNQNKELTYFMFNDPALNGFDPGLTKNREQEATYHLIGEEKIQTLTLSKVLDQYLPTNQEIDFLSIDVEGLDLEVLQSNDWKKYKPKVVLVEALETHMDQPLSNPIAELMRNYGYELKSKTFNTAIYRLKI